MASSAVEEGAVSASGAVIGDAPGHGAPGKKDGEEAPAVKKEETSAVEAKEKSLENAPAVESKDKALDLGVNTDVNKVKAPGFMERTMEEVEAVAEALHEKLDLKGTNDENKDQNEERDGIFKRLLKKIGFK
ncbi:uncharacterized protein LOC112341625 [Selaginella moellendorffii]|uniref:uncharacterized protein LOC112341625 n=1 Tax=Selaginella moellendorffii TaxID=88036 RepID=UPI000D1C4804|nr:uncharacterized protein LOC112341625 [Selaginella moellendorffii]|eukprot:XP_024517856.1 uncharacterized protein LOC112341625 [Selaginella moellendorffii]